MAARAAAGGAGNGGVLMSPEERNVPLASETRVYPFAFTGDAKEYFRIWIVNLFLSVVTLGIYSAWAKVRKKRYFYGNTWVADANFDYHGEAIAILKGRVIAVLALIAYNVSGHYLPRLGMFVLLILMVAAPWLIVRSMQFNAVNSSYRNLRFGFHGRYLEGLRAIAPLLLSPLLVLLFPPLERGRVPASGTEFALLLLPSLPIIIFYPYVMGAIKRFQVRRSTYGSAAFDIAVKIRSFYRIYLTAGFFLIVISVAAGVMAFALMMVPQIAWLLMLLSYLLTAAVIFGYTRTRVANLTFNSTVLGANVRFVSSLSARKLAWIYFVNLLAIVISLGLLVPWAAMRAARYRVSCLSLRSRDDLEGFLGSVARPVGATADQVGEFFEVDLSL
jgi:uncharacterized membrane protein YjgN (DUF898 family)